MPSHKPWDVSDERVMPIAIVGMACRMPGDATNPEKLWDMLLRKHSAQQEIPSNRWNKDAFYHPNGDRNGSINVRGGHFIEQDIAAFDAPFFSISPAEAIAMDPMQRMLLEVAYEATENAGLPLSNLAGSKTGCYVGCFGSDYKVIQDRDPERLEKYHATGTGQSILANRLSFWFDLKGPSMTLDTACSSGLVGLHLACQSLRSGETNNALVGATNLILDPQIGVALTNSHFLSPDSLCHTFDHRANGYARGDGITALILKPLHHALRDGDTVRAVIRSTAVNSDGATPAITLPSKEAQVSLIKTAYESADLDPSVTGYFEAHGTGTAAGDPLESGAIGLALGIHRPKTEEGKLYVGSIKTNIGHLEGASGLAGLIKAVMSVEHGVIAPNLWFQKGNPAIDFDGWCIRVPTEAVPWPTTGLRRASVNSFGYGGTNAHVVIDDAFHFMQLRGLDGKHHTTIPAIEHQHHSFPESVFNSIPIPKSPSTSASEYSSYHNSRSMRSSRSSSRSTSATQYSRPQSPKFANWTTSRPRIFHIAANDDKAIKRYASVLKEHLMNRVVEDEREFLDDLAFTLGERRSLLPYSISLVTSTKEELIRQLESPSIVVRRTSKTPRVGFVFTGQGAQYWSMGRELLDHPIFADTLYSCDKVVRKLDSPWSVLGELSKDEKSSRMNEAAISQPLCTAIQIALIHLYASWNIHPYRVVGHSSGEIAAAYATGALSLESAMTVAYHRGVLAANVTKLGHKGGMMAAGMSEDEARSEIAKVDTSLGKVAIACVNSPRSVTISGDISALNHLQKELISRGCFARRLQVDTAYHSHHMLSIAEAYRNSMKDLQVAPWSHRNPVEMYSSVTGKPITRDDHTALNADYWVENMVSSVRFSDALSQLCVSGGQDQKQDGNLALDFLIEIGPHSALAGPIKQTLSTLSTQKPAIQYLSALVRGKDASMSSLQAAASLFAQSYPVNMRTAQFPRGYPRTTVLVDLPSYSWNHERTYWAESRLSHNYRFRQSMRMDILGAPSPDWNPIEPQWRNIIRVSEQPWVKSHMVQQTIIYPAAGYCCMAIKAAQQIHMISERKGGISEFKLREITISNALVIPEDDEGVEVAFNMRPYNNTGVKSSETWSEFRIFSHKKQNGWSEHCRGLISTVYENAQESPISLETIREVDHVSHCKLLEARSTCNAEIDCVQMYKDLDANGLTFGPEFQTIASATAGPHRVLGQVQVTDTRSCMPQKFEFSELLHPATMDAFVQVSGLKSYHRGSRSPYIPKFIQEITVSAKLSANVGEIFEVVGESRANGFREEITNVIAFEADRVQPSITLNGVQCIAIAVGASSDAASQQLSIPKWTANAVWDTDVDLISKDNLASVLRDAVHHPFKNRLPQFELLAWYYTSKLLNTISGAEIAKMQPHHQKFYRYLQHNRDLIQSENLEHFTEDWMNLDNVNVDRHISELIAEYDKSSDFEGRMLVRMGASLAQVLRQEVDPLALMMEDGLLNDYYTTSLGSPLTNQQIGRYVNMLSHKYPDLEYLEIGAGTGGTTAHVMEALVNKTTKQEYPRMKSYTFTDISSGFFEAATERFKDYADHMKFDKLDIEQDPDSQGFSGKLFDVVVAANVLHATTDINQTMTHVRKLLKPGGKLILLDQVRARLSTSLIWGNIAGWWASCEPWREWGPLLDEHQWQKTLRDCGFGDFLVSSPDYVNTAEEVTRVMIATAVEKQPQQGILDASLEPKYVTLIKPTTSSCADTERLCEALKDALQSMGAKVDMQTLDHLQQTDLNGRVYLSLIELQNSMLPEVSSEHLEVLQRIVQESAGLLWITQGGLMDGVKRPELSLFHGLARSIRAEHENFPCVTIDLESKFDVAGRDIELIMSVYKASFGSVATNNVVDCEFYTKNGLLHIKRTFENKKLNHEIAAYTGSASRQVELQDVTQQDRPLKLKPQSFGILESLVFDDDPTMSEPLGADDVEIEVRAVGLNFRDVLISMGEINDNYLGNECSGVVVKAGINVKNVAVGDRVAAWCLGSFKNVMRNPAHCVQRIPDTMSFSKAAALPLVYVTAYYALLHIARLEKGESVLIHAAAGGVGQAAIQLAQSIGAEVYVTVSSLEKKDHIMTTYNISEDHIFSSRDLAFADGLHLATNGRGVDVILNSLAGDALQATWRCIAPFGRFIEIGKRDLDINTRLEMAPFAKNVTFSSVDVTVIFRQNKKLAAGVFSKAMAYCTSGGCTEPSPMVVQPFSKIEEMFRLMQAGKHMGKIILEPRAGDLVKTVPKAPQRISFSSEASYLLAGGLGGLGRSMARWMADKGARNLIFVSRSGATSEKANTFVQQLEAEGVRCIVIKCDIADAAKLTGLVSETLKTLPPIRGVVQGAMVLRDMIFANMSRDAFLKAIQPKVQGSWALHTATLDQPLDFFVLLSSAASYIGNAGQSNYAAGCTYQVALAAHRHALGLPATAIDLGKMAEVGYVAENLGSMVEHNLERLGAMDIREDEFLAMLEFAMLHKDDGNVSNGHMVTGIYPRHDASSSTPSTMDIADLPRWCRDPVFSHASFVRPHVVELEARKHNRDIVSSSSAAQKPLATLLAAATTKDDAMTVTLDVFLHKLSRSLMLAVDEIDVSRPTAAYGLDSLIAVEIKNFIFREAKVEMAVFDILQASSLIAVVEKIVKNTPLIDRKILEE